jgi:hypothetical protein
MPVPKRGTSDRLDVGQREHRRALRQALVDRVGQAVQAGRLEHRLEQRVPLLAGAALAAPFAADAAAVAAGVAGFLFCHGV